MWQSTFARCVWECQASHGMLNAARSDHAWQKRCSRESSCMRGYRAGPMTASILLYKIEFVYLSSQGPSLDFTRRQLFVPREQPVHGARRADAVQRFTAILDHVASATCRNYESVHKKSINILMLCVSITSLYNAVRYVPHRAARGTTIALRIRQCGDMPQISCRAADSAHGLVMICFCSVTAVLPASPTWSLSQTQHVSIHMSQSRDRPKLP